MPFFPDEFQKIRGRGVASAPGNRFERHEIQIDWGAVEESAQADEDFDPPSLKTVVFRDESQSIISRNDSPDINFGASVNPYRGCEHGCAYCYARPFHEYLGFNAGIDFETKLMAKENAPELLRNELSKKSWKPQVLAMSGVTDCYQPVERKLKLTRGCLEVLVEFCNPVGIVTKNHLVTRDIDLLGELALKNAATVAISITSLDTNLQRSLEPRASTPRARLRAIRELANAGVPVGVSVAPIIPGLNEHEIPAILEAARDHGAKRGWYSVVRLPHGVKEMFADWLEYHFPDRKEKVLGRIRELRGGKLNSAEFGERMRGQGAWAGEIERLFKINLRRYELNREHLQLNTSDFRRPSGPQLEMPF
ncbi:MAG: PA0069 family radical SAM protein [Verrucomicrobiota bacterium]